MKIDNFIRIIDGKLITKPPIDAFASICFDLHRLSHADLFIDLHASRENIHHALQKGAYAIVTTLKYIDEDEECAWIEVSNIEQMLIRLLRYTITQKSLTLLCLSPIQAALLEQIHTPKSYRYLKNDLASIARTLLNAKENDGFYSDDALLLESIAPTAIRPCEQTYHSTQKGLFLSTFEHQGALFSDQKIPAHHVNALLSLLNVCDEHAIAYDINLLSFSAHFYPQFVSHSLVKKEFGASDKVLIFEPLETLIEGHLAYIRGFGITPLLCLGLAKDACLPMDNAHYFSSYEELQTILLTHPSTYTLIACEKEAFEPYFRLLKTEQPTLF